MVETKDLSVNACERIHAICNSLPRYRFPFFEASIPLNGIYVVFEVGEVGHQRHRIVRIGTHRGQDNLRGRLKEHFINENKDRSIFRKNIGRAILSQHNDFFLKEWEWDLTSRKNRLKYEDVVDIEKKCAVETEVSAYIQNFFSFVIIPMAKQQDRMNMEAKLISTVSLCDECSASENWLGRFSPQEKIRKSGLWLVNHLWKEPLKEEDFAFLEDCIEGK